MTNKFSSKEIHFLKTDSDNPGINPPEKYFSDLLLKKTLQIEAFENRLSGSNVPLEQFLCAVIQISIPVSDQKSSIDLKDTDLEDAASQNVTSQNIFKKDAASTHESLLEKSKKIFEDTFNSILNDKNQNYKNQDIKKGSNTKVNNKRGIWESLGTTSFVLAFWDYKTDEQASQLIISLKEKISKALNAKILIGIAKFPYHNFLKNHIFDSAIKAIDHAAFFGNDALIEFDATSLNICGDRFYHLNECEMALNEYKKGLEIEPNNINLINSIGVCFGVMGQLDKAKAEFKKGLKVNPEELMVIYNIGLLYQIEGNIDKAIIYLRKAHGIDPGVFEVELLLGSLLNKKERGKQALPHLDCACKIKPDSALPFRMRGEIYLRDKLFEKADLEFNKAIKINPEDAMSLSGYARSLELQDKNLKIALSFAKNCINIEPKNKLFIKRLNIIKEKIKINTMPVDDIKTA